MSNFRHTGAGIKVRSDVFWWFVGAFRCRTDKRLARIGPMGDPKSQLRSGRFANVKRNDRATGHRVAQNVIGVGFHFRVLGLALAAMVVGMVLLSGTVVTRAMHLGFCFCMNHSGMQLRVRITGHPKQDAGQDKCRRHKHADDVSRQLHEVYLTQFL